MAEAEQSAEATNAPGKSGKKKLVLLLAPLLLLGAGLGGAVAFVPSLRAMIPGMGGSAAKAEKTETAEVAKPFFVEIPEMTVTMPNGGHARQMRIKIALELAKTPHEGESAPNVLTPRIYDGLVLYMRTLHDNELDGALSIDKMRGDLQRRLDLLLGEGVLREVLITGLVVG